MVKIRTKVEIFDFECRWNGTHARDEAIKKLKDLVKNEEIQLLCFQILEDGGPLKVLNKAQLIVLYEEWEQ